MLAAAKMADGRIRVLIIADIHRYQFKVDHNLVSGKPLRFRCGGSLSAFARTRVGFAHVWNILVMGDRVTPARCRRLVARHKIADRRDIGQGLYPSGGRHSQGAQPAGPDLLDRGNREIEHDLDLSADEVGDRWPASAIVHRKQVEPRHFLEEFSIKMWSAPQASRRHADIAGSRYFRGWFSAKRKSYAHPEAYRF
jgi:hypothetical protein